MGIKNFQNILEAMRAAGCTPEQILAAIDYQAGLEAERLKEHRAKRAEQKRNERARKAEMSPNVAATDDMSQRHDVCRSDLSPPSSPSNGSPPTPYIGNIDTPLSLTPSSTPSHDNAHVRERFEEFWKLYPRKVGKGKARVAWLKAVRSASPDVIIAAVQAAQFSPDPEFVPHPSTWLNGERWLDEKPAPRLTMADRVAQQALETEREEQERTNQNVLPFWRL